MGEIIEHSDICTSQELIPRLELEIDHIPDVPVNLLPVGCYRLVHIIGDPERLPVGQEEVIPRGGVEQQIFDGRKVVVRMEKECPGSGTKLQIHQVVRVVNFTRRYPDPAGEGQAPRIIFEILILCTHVDVQKPAFRPVFEPCVP